MVARNTAGMLLGALAAGLLWPGCQAGGPARIPTEREKAQMLALMLPQQIKIEPFSKIKSFSGGDRPDGVLLVLRPQDRFGDPVKATGHFYFEMWTFQEASSERKGERLAFWERTIGTPQEVVLYWTRAQMYEFQLVWTAGVADLRPGAKYILTATYRTPWDETLQDEYVLEFPLGADLMGGSKKK